MNSQSSRQKPVNPQRNASRLSKMTFWWTRHMFKMGLSKQITEDDVYETIDHHQCDRIAKRFSQIWQNELKNSKNPSTLRMFYNAYGPSVLIIGLLFSIVETLMRCAQPLLLGELLTYFAEENSSKKWAYIYASGIVICSLIPVLAFHPFIYYIFEVGMKTRIGCSRLVYDKILRITKCVQEDGLQGKVINLLSNDFAKFDLALAFLHDLWKGPFETILLGFLIYREVGISGVFGILFILSFIPIQSYIGKKSAHFRNQTTKRTDIRVRLMNEIINGIQVIKMYSWQQNFAKVIEKVRKKEIAAVKGSSYILALLYTLWAISRVSLFLTLITFVYSGNVLTARKVFIVTAFYNILNLSMVHFWPLAITFCAEGYVSSRRLRDFLLMPETKKKSMLISTTIENGKEKDEMKIIAPQRIHDKISSDSSPSSAIIFKDLSANWINSDEESVTGLKLINYEFKRGSTYAIIGSVGSGKSSFLQAILGELEIDSGRIEIFGSVSYANQEAFLFEGTVRNNILFTEEYDETRYRKVCTACGLIKDFEQLEKGDETVVGEKGVSLSGGQKARINLARAVYKEADIYLLDDILSAVDAHVGSVIFNECVMEYLREKTVILVTHQLQYLHRIENILVLADGQIKASGTYHELEDREIASLLPVEKSNDTQDQSEKYFQELTKHLKPKSPEEFESYNEKESQESGTVRFEVYKNYVKSIQNAPLVIFVLFLRVLNQSIASFIDYFVSQWVNWEESLTRNSTSMVANDTLTLYDDDGNEIDQKRQQFINIYIAIICIFIVVILKAEFSFFYSLLRASRNLHDMMFRGLVNTYLQFFNQNPSGRILNRFSKDIGSIDTQLPNTMFECICFVLEFIAIMILVSLVNVYFAIPTLIMALILFGLRHIYVNTSRNIKRVESISKSPIFAHTNATLQGLSTIRALNAENAVIQNFNSYIDHNSSAWFMFWTITRSFAFWLDIICVIYIAVITFSFVEMNVDDVPGGNLGLAITQIIGLIGMTQWGIRQTSELENQMVSVERVMEYANFPSEMKNEKAPPANWPSCGEIEFDNLSLYYKHEECKPAIRNLSFKIKSQEKVGIVGRTGSGKSSIIQALFRMTRIEGSIKIDGIDTQEIDLHNLRKSISIIPQDPVLFSGSLRFNLDAFSENSDDAIWKVLESVELKETIKSLTGGLECKISDGGSNFSVGQRQLICLARALLRRNKILILDEATANVDYETDTLIQKTINAEFSDCTLIVIAHRLHTVINSDKILVMEGGNLVEYDHPYYLLKNENGYLRKLVNQTSLSLLEEAEKSFHLKSEEESKKHI